MATRSKLSGFFHRRSSIVRHFTGEASSSGTGNVPAASLDKWIVVLKLPENVSDKDKVNAFVRMAAKVLKSNQIEAKQKIYKMETKRYYGFHIYASEEIARKFVAESEVYQVLPEPVVLPEKVED